MTSGASSQSNASGVVTDAGGEPLPGVSVVVRGTSAGTSTNAEGRFQLENVPADAVLVFSLLGFQPQEVPLNGAATLTVQMESDVAALSEVVVIGYGTTSREDFTDRKGVVWGKSVSVRVDHGGGRIINKNKQET